MKGNGVIQDFNTSVRRSIMSGYIIVPSDIERDKYIKRSLRLNQYSVLVEKGGGVINNCYATKSTIKDIKFPLEGEKLGSGVVFFTDPFTSKTVIIGVVNKNDESELLDEEVISFKKTKDGNYSVITIDGRGAINIDVVGKAGIGELNINVRNDDHTSSINVHVKGSVNVYTEGDVNFNVIDGDINMSISDSLKVIANRILFNDANESMVKGNELKTNLDLTNDVVRAILSVITGVPIPTATAGQPDTLQVALQSALAGKTLGSFNKINSDKSYLS